MRIFKDFDGGNIDVIDAKNPDHIRLNIEKDNASDFYQWFYFGVEKCKGQTLSMHIENAKGAAFEGGWTDYSACASYDDETWFRVPTHYEDGVLKILHTPSHDLVYYAYFAPYPMARHKALIAQYAAHDAVTHIVLGQTLDGQDMDLLSFGSGPKKIWVDARQHPGETMAEWWMEGFLGRLLGGECNHAKTLMEKATFYVIPNMNPDGGVRGNLRTNAAGANLNREWGVATMERSPEVALVMAKMKETGVDLSLDVHGDEALPYNFIAGAEGVPGFTGKDLAKLHKFLDAYKRATPAFQTEHGYPVTAPGKANLTYATTWTAHIFGCLSMTLEMPFKDDANNPDPDFGWSPERAAQLGYDVVPALFDIVDDL